MLSPGTLERRWTTCPMPGRYWRLGFRPFGPWAASGHPRRKPRVLSLEIPGEPVSRQLRNLLECTRFLEQMCRAGNDLHLLRPFQMGKRLPVQIDDDIIAAANDKERRNGHCI